MLTLKSRHHELAGSERPAGRAVRGQNMDLDSIRQQRDMALSRSVGYPDVYRLAQLGLGAGVARNAGCRARLIPVVTIASNGTSHHAGK